MASNQWRITPSFGGAPHYSGLDYAACRAAWDSAGIQMTPDLWLDFREIEGGALKSLNNR